VERLCRGTALRLWIALLGVLVGEASVIFCSGLDVGERKLLISCVRNQSNRVFWRYRRLSDCLAFAGSATSRRGCSNSHARDLLSRLKCLIAYRGHLILALKELFMNENFMEMD
jgi:hypothetical protein